MSNRCKIFSNFCILCTLKLEFVWFALSLPNEDFKKGQKEKMKKKWTKLEKRKKK